MAMFSKILIANRGEIALRVIKTAKRLGIRTVALYSEADRQAQHVLAADEAVCVGPAAASEGYLQIDKVIAAAKQTGAQAIHPGYGFLSENAAFSRACAENGIEFIGPAASSIEAMGDKAAAKTLLENSAVPLVPGFHGETLGEENGEDQRDDRLCAEAERIGFPVLLKASAGGGGKGMRVVEKAADVLENIISARREGLSSFGDDRLLIEKYLLKPRHVEVQVFCDKHGNGVYLFERDCSVQRRHQKVIEEAPAPGFNEDEDLRRRMGEAALAAAHKINYVGAGTVEFLLDSRGDFFFMEMNTRLQVEHPVTEMVTDQDLVEWQLRVAAGETLPVTQDQLSVNGHSIEVRIYAEDADDTSSESGFLPAIGDLTRLRWPQACNFDRTSSVRVDSGVIEGDTVSPYYDPMIAKLIVWGADRNAAIIRMQQALSELEIDGVKNNRDFLARLMAEPDFINADLSTDFIDRHELDAEQDTNWLLGALIELAAVELESEAQPATAVSSDPWNINDHFRMNLNARETVYLNTASGDSCVARVQHHADGSLLIEVEDDSYLVNGLSLNNGVLSYELDGKIQRHNVKITDDEAIIWLEKATKRYARNVWLGAGDGHGGALSGTNRAPMSGQVLEVNVKAGDQVEAGQVLMIMEAMKMEHSIRAVEDGVVEQVFYGAGDQVFEGVELIALAESES